MVGVFGVALRFAVVVGSAQVGGGVPRCAARPWRFGRALQRARDFAAWWAPWGRFRRGSAEFWVTLVPQATHTHAHNS